jgi:fructokinase
LPKIIRTCRTRHVALRKNGVSRHFVTHGHRGDDALQKMQVKAHSMADDSGRIAGLELGGTKAIAVLWQDGSIIDEQRVATTDPDTTFAALLPVYQRWAAEAAFDAIGIGSFGPVALAKDAADYGHIRTTPKPGWSGAAIAGRFAALFPCTIGIDTDVNAAALAEARWGAGRGCSSIVYLTIGTGVGGGVLVNGAPLHGRLHPELGHVSLRRAPDDRFGGHCPFHGDCVEGLLSGPALAARFGMAAEHVPADHPDWRFVAHDLAQFLATLIHGFAPNRILIGGGAGLGLPQVRTAAMAMLPELLGGYYPDLDTQALAAMIGPPALGDQAGPLGAIAVGLKELGR